MNPPDPPYPPDDHPWEPWMVRDLGALARIRAWNPRRRHSIAGKKR